MNYPKAIAILFLAILGATALQASDRVLRDGWEFSRDGTAWQGVRVPHDWAIAGPFNAKATDGGDGKLPWKGRGFYRLTLTPSAAEWALLRTGGKAYLDFGGVMAAPRVKLNGQDVGGWDYGYMGFTLDVTDKLHEGANRLEVTCDTTAHHSRWYPGAGIYRRVIFAVRAPLHVLPGTLAITTPSVTREEATVRVAYRTPAYPTNYTFRVKKPRLWDVDDPYLHTLDILGEKVRYGIRSFAFTTNDGFHLNGRRVQIKGANLHADLGLLGMAFDRSAVRRQLTIMREMGCNAIRTSHNAPADELVELCDEMGFIVWNECFDKWDATSGRRAEQDLESYVLRNLRQFVRRFRNHPSVVIWSISNEIWEWDPTYDYGFQDPAKWWLLRSPDGQTQARNSLFAAAVRLEDPTRPVTCGNRPYMNEPRILNLNLWKDLDVVGWNYFRAYAAARKHDPTKPIVYSESASAVSSNGYFSDDVPDFPYAFRKDAASGTFQVDGMDLCQANDIADADLDRMDRDRYVAGEFVWTGIDYLGEPAPFGAEARSSYFGCVDLTGVPKDRFYLYRAHWKSESPTVHIVPHWNWEGHQNTKRTVFVYTNGDEGELFLNGRSLGRHRKGEKCPFTNACYAVISKYRLIWPDVTYEPGELKAVAWKNGIKVGEEIVRTAGASVALAAVQEPCLTDDRDELRWVRVHAVDAQGIRHPRAHNRIRFSLTGSGEIVAVGNGDPTGMRPFTQTDAHDLFFGRAMAVIRRTSAGPLKLTVSADNLAPATATIK